ncbi:MAG: hypothetical protein R3D71_07865 [Rickettsiales bacterium]
MFFFHRMTKKEKERFLRRQNQINQNLFSFVRNRLADTRKAKEKKEGLELAKTKEKIRKKKKDGKKEAWSEKVGTIRNRLNDKRRVSKDRWNRFAGTEDAGARGR